MSLGMVLGVVSSLSVPCLLTVILVLEHDGNVNKVPGIFMERAVKDSIPDKPTELKLQLINLYLFHLFMV